MSLTFPVSSEEQQRVCADNVVEVVDDERLEDVETFHLEIATTVPRIRIGQSTATVRVEDDDMVEVAMSSPELTVEEGEQVSVCVTRRGVIERMVAVNLSLVPHTAGGEEFVINKCAAIIDLSLSLTLPSPSLSLSLSHTHTHTH